MKYGILYMVIKPRQSRGGKYALNHCDEHDKEIDHFRLTNITFHWDNIMWRMRARKRHVIAYTTTELSQESAELVEAAVF
jgi:hypothetical protein